VNLICVFKDYKVITRATFLFLCLSCLTVYLNNLRNKSFINQVVLHNDLSNGSYSLNIDQVEKINHKYPSLAHNSIPIATLKSRYYMNEEYFSESNQLLNQGINYHPFLSFSFYLKSILYINQKKLIEAKNYIKEAYALQPNINIIAVLYISLLAEAQDFSELIMIKDDIMNSNDIQIWVYYLNAILETLDKNSSQDVEDIFQKAISVFPINESINKLYYQYKTLD
jgi:tetratricopeptide (TPR) repeat protein